MKKALQNSFIGIINLLIICLLTCNIALSQVPANINTGNPNFPFPQFKAYTGAANTLANQNPVGVPHAELEQRTRDAYAILCNNMTYNVNQNGTYANLTVNGVRYIMPNEGNGSSISHCTCVEADAYYLLAAAYMGDKATFDGYYMWAHDRQFQKTVRFSDNVMNSPGYNYSPGISGAGSAGASTNVYGGALGGNSAADGDVDLALALLVAWKQWGNAGQICNDPQLGVITYRNEAIKYIKTMVDTLKYAPSLPISRYLSGIVGLDGYLKGGDSWNETSTWAQTGYLGMMPLATGGQTNYVDYAAPAYFHSFANMLTAEGERPFLIDQYRRAEASCDWVMGQAYAQGYIPWIGQYAITGTTVTLTNFNKGGEDFRYGWRTIMNYMWHGAPTRTWNPTTHTYTAATNTYNLNMATRMASLLHHPENAPFNNACYASSTGITYGGTSNIKWEHDMNGTNGGAFVLNLPIGAQSPSAVVANNWDLMSQMFRQCVIDFDDYLNPSGAQRYLTGKPRYFHEWFRLLGMLVLTGNMHDPMDFATGAAQSNMKVYKAIDKTFAYPGDTITYTISYRNYSKQGATGVVITDNLPSGLTYISSTGGGSSAGSTVTWNIGNVTGFLSGGLAATMGSVTVKVKVGPAATGRLCNVATITATNGTGWTSNEYPNNITDVMERNCVDILSQKPLSITKKASKATTVAGDTLSYTIVVKNNSVPFINGGRQGVIVAGANGGVSNTPQSQLLLKYRVYHGAHEPLINYKNYRVSYYLKKTPLPTWQQNITINEGSGGNVPTLTQQTLAAGATWNHRFILTFPNQRATITPMLYARYNSNIYIHEGAMEPMRLVSQIHDASWANYDFSTDWSAEPAINVGDGHAYFPIANDWTDPLLPNQAVTKIHPNQCGTITATAQKQLVEEWDGYTWRRAYGNAPVSGRELTGIVVKDYLPSDVTFVNYFPGYPTGSLSSGVITWPTVTQLLTGDSIVYKFWVTVKPCSGAGFSFVNTGEAKAVNEPVVTATATTNTTCGPAPITLLYFSANNAEEGNLLTWATSTETNNSHFVVERSEDGVNFESIGSLPGAGNSNTVKEYSYMDQSYSAHINYYRIKQLDFDGKSTSSSIEKVSTGTFEVSYYPNPFTAQTNLIVRSQEAEAKLTITSVLGVELEMKTIETNKEISLGEEYASGTYFLYIEAGVNKERIRLVKNK